jgi:two-component system, sensor histidine kinase and response regulator
MYDLKVLAVDDEPNMCSGIARILQNFKMSIPDIEDTITFNVDTAGTGEEALEKIRLNQPDILFLDYKLPGISGLEVLEHIEQKDDKMITIMITAFASLETAVSAIKSGAFDFLAKPFTPQELRSVITKAAQSLILARQVRKLNEEKRQVRFQFISVLGHELKAPLSAVEGYLNMIHDRACGNELITYDNMVDRCLVRTDQMRKLIADILEMTKIEAGTRKREVQELDLSEIAKMTIETVTPDALKNNIKINLVAETPSNFIADKVEMEMVFNNLISNAVKYNRPDGEVNIKIEKVANEVTIEVKDTGIGMTKEDSQKLFNEFVRIKNSKTKNIMGSGLGLSTVKKIAKIYNGDALVESVPDVGSTFTIRLIEEVK